MLWSLGFANSGEKNKFHENLMHSFRDRDHKGLTLTIWTKSDFYQNRPFLTLLDTILTLIHPLEFLTKFHENLKHGFEDRGQKGLILATWAKNCIFFYQKGQF